VTARETSRPDSAARPLLAPLALTMGDPAGVGPDIALMAWLARDRLALPAFAIYADAESLARRARELGLQVPIARIDRPEEAADRFGTALPVRHIALSAQVVPGRPDSSHAPAIIAAIETATADVAGRRAAALVTNPIAKHVLYAAGFHHSGHTEFLAELARRFDPSRSWVPVMMLASEVLRVVPLTVHVPLASVPKAVTREHLLTTIRITHGALRRDFGVAEPRIVVAGLNPHAGESGSIGREEVDVIAPAIAELAAQGLSVTGPYSADSLFHPAARARYDAAIAMYHDQALIPLKTLSFDTGVNVTLGLPFVRTSPDHGTAFDIAGSGAASPSSLVAALKMAAAMAGRRAEHDA
jgi:4-hydroxythreonine-4-phosphate dehydrogenase